MPATPSTSKAHDSRRLVGVHPERVSDVSSTDFPGHYPGEDHSWSMHKFKENFQVKVMRLSNRSIEFDLVGVDASIANAFRRIMIAEVPTVCIEHVYVWNNTSVIQDEILAQRLGLVPLNVDPDLFEMKSDGDPSTDRNTLVFRLEVTCTRNKSAPPGTTDDAKLYNDSLVTAGHLVWVPQGEQEELPAFLAKPPAPTNQDIVLTKLRPGQAIEMELHAIKGLGKEHAKWSPVATASYRLLPHVTLNPSKPVPPHLSAKFAACFSPGVIHINPKTKAVTVNESAVRGESMSREVYRHPEFEGCAQLGRVRDHFIFNVESEGPYTPERIFSASIRVMRQKIAVLRKAAEALLAEAEGGHVEEEIAVKEGEANRVDNGGDNGDVIMMDT